MSKYQIMADDLVSTIADKAEVHKLNECDARYLLTERCMVDQSVWVSAYATMAEATQQVLDDPEHFMPVALSDLDEFKHYEAQPVLGIAWSECDWRNDD
jgi:hypothetical protein